MEDDLVYNTSYAAKTAFPEIPFPNKKDEYWRFCDYSLWNTNALFPYFAAHTQHVKNASFDAMEKSFCDMPDSLVLSDGIQMHSDLDSSKIEVIPLIEAAKKYPENFKKLYANTRGKFDILPSSRAGWGLYIKVAKGASARLNLFEASKLSLSISALLFDISEGASLKLLHKNTVYGGSFQVGRIGYMLSKNARLERASFSFGDVSARKYRREDFYLGESSEVLDAFAELGSEHTRQERNFFLEARQAKMDSRVFSSCRSDVIRDIRTEQKHLAEDCSGNVALRTALYDNSKLAFSGLIRVEEAAQKTNAYLSSRSLLMSDTATAQASPILEICANDISCSHGCTVSKPDEEQLFYMQSRGLSLDESKRLIVEGFAESTFEHLEDSLLRDSLKSHSDLF